MKIALESFAGEIPKTQPRYLPPQYAQSVTKARLNRGDLEPVRDDVTIQTLSAAADRIYLYGSTWLSWAVDADAVPGPVAEDRLYITRANAAPQMLYSGAFYGLALQPPDTAPVLTALTAVDETTAEDILYAYTWVTSLGEESAPSPLSTALLWSDGVVVRIQSDATPPAGRMITHKRIYRSQTGAAGSTDLYFVAERPATEMFYDHDADIDLNQEPIGTFDFDMPPDDMRGITSMPNGMMAAFTEREVLFCEPFIPHAWPIKYRLKVNDTIVGLAAFGTSLAVLTTGQPYILQGIHPDQMAMERSEQGFPCLSKRGIVDMGYAAIYPSTDGLVQIGTQGSSLISAPLWTPEQWRKLQPGSIRASHQSGRYAFSYIPASTGAALPRQMGYIDMTGQSPFFLPVAEPYLDLHHHLETGRLCALAADGRTVVSIDDDDGVIDGYSWLSKPFKLPAPASFGVVKIDSLPPPSGTEPSFTLKIMRDGVLLHTITDAEALSRLPSGLSEEWQFEISGNHTVTRVAVAGSADELHQ